VAIKHKEGDFCLNCQFFQVIIQLIIMIEHTVKLAKIKVLGYSHDSFTPFKFISVNQQSMLMIQLDCCIWFVVVFSGNVLRVVLANIVKINVSIE